MATEVEAPVVIETETIEVKTEEVVVSDENHVEENKQQDEQAEENTAEAEANAVDEGEKQEENGIEPPKVNLYQHPPWNNIPSPLPACIKVETYCRMMKIPYENVYKSGTDQKLPFIEYQGETKRHDLIGYLNTKFEVDADSGLNDKDKACSRAFQCMAEENTFWSLMYYRWVDNFAETKKYFKGLDVVRKNIRPKLDQGKCVKCLEAHEIGKHNKEEIYAIGEKDLRAMSNFLEDKEFFMGSEPTVIDCTMFGLLSCLLHTAESSPLAKVVREDLKNLVDFCDRMKFNYWLDWSKLGTEEQVEETRPKSRLSVKKKKRTKSSEPPELKEGEASGDKADEEKKENGDAEKEEGAEEGETAEATEGKQEEEEAKEGDEPKESDEKTEESPVVNGDGGEKEAEGQQD